MDNYKRWMLIFRWKVDDLASDEIFYFDTKEKMIEFAKQEGVLVEKMFHLEEVIV